MALDINDIKPNSHAYKAQQEEERKVDRVVSGNVTTRKKTRTKRFTELFLSDDIHDVKSYVLFDLVIPAIKDTIIKGMEMMFFGTTSSKSHGGRNSITDYNSISRRNDRRDDGYARLRQPYEVDDIITETRREAEDLLNALLDEVEEYGEVSVRTFYDFAGVTSHSYTDTYYGWKSLRSAYTAPIRGGYTVIMPRCIQIR